MMMIRAGLLVLLLVGASLASDFAGTKNIQTDDADIGPTSCHIPCRVKYNGTKNFVFKEYKFAVSWTFRPRSGKEYHSVTDTHYWINEYGLALSVADPQCRRILGQPNSTGSLQLDCGLTIASCSDRKYEAFRGFYICKVQHRFTEARFDVYSELQHQIRGVVTDNEPSCYHPDAVNMSAAVSTINSTQMVTVQWDSTIRPTHMEYCHGSRRYSVYVLMFEPEDLDDYMDNGPVLPAPEIFYINTSQARDTHYTHTPPVSRDKYYIFQIRNRYKDTTGMYLYNQFPSPIFYFGEQRSPYFLESDDITLTVSVGDTVTIQCPAGGAPPPHVLLIRNGRKLGTLTGTGYQIIVSLSDVGDYYCSASSIHVNPPYLKRRLTVNKKVTIKRAVSVNITHQHPCQPYNGGICRNFIHEDTNVLVNSGAELLESTISEQIGLIGTYTASHHGNLASTRYMTAGITEKTIDQCYDFIRGIACSSVYPYCDASSTTSHPVPRPLCKHTCNILRAEGFCGFFLDPSFLEEYRYQLFPLRYALFASCDNRTTPGGESPECIYVSLDSPAVDSPGEGVVEQVECVKGNGRSYAGHLSRTASGLPCQSWYSQSPNAHSIVPAHFQLELYGASFSCRNPGGIGERPWCYIARGSGRWEYCNPPQCHTCEMYGGQFCSSLSGYRERSVHVNREGWSSVSLGDIEGSMVGLYHSLEGDKLSPACQNALTLLICHGSLPFCKDGVSPSPLSSCVDHCTLRDEMRLVCPVKVLSELTSRWSSTHRVNQLLGPDCSLSSSEQCMPSPTIITTQAVSSCYNSSDYGQSYSGPHSRTVSNLPCMDWSETNTSFTATLYPELVGAGSTCRNPGQWAKAPWCFNNQGLVELCLVESCSIVGIETKDPSSSNPASAVAPVVLGICVVIAICVTVSGVVGFVVYKHKKQTTASSPQLHVIGNDSVKNVKFRDNNQYPRIQLLPPKVATAIASFKQVPKANIEYVKQLGQGFFGMVFKGKLRGMEGSSEPDTHVAVKTLKEDTNDGIEAFVNEAKLMFGFDHENIVKILAVSMTQAPYYLVFEYMDKGDLAKFLRENASSLQRRYMNPLDRPRSRTESTLSDDPASLNQEQLTDICKQIVQGMEYLSVMNYVHRDLACRNCLVSSLPDDDCSATPSRVLVKIGDFGLSHNLYSKDYYRVRGQAVLPIRWMSPEAIIYGKFSTAGDVWSFGVVMWEVFTLGMQPYYGTSNEEVMERVRHGKVLQKPSDCSGRIYAIMNECWAQDDQSRPTFKELSQCLEECRVSTSSEYDAQSMYSDISSDAFLEENSDPETEMTKDD